MKKATYKAIMALLNDTCGMDNMCILKDKVMTSYGSSDLDLGDEDSDDVKWIPAKVRETKASTRPELNSYEMAMFYDGGYMYSVMSAEFGWSSHDRFIEKLEAILKKDGLAYEQYDNVTMVIFRD